jgi:hypothetical protein
MIFVATLWWMCGANAVMTFVLVAESESRRKRWLQAGLTLFLTVAAIVATVRYEP